MTSALMIADTTEPAGGEEVIDSFACFGSTCAVYVTGDGPRRSAAEAVALARRLLLSWHARCSRFERSSELSRLNGDGRTTVPVSPLLGRFVEAAVLAARLTDGLVDPTLGREIVASGYDRDLPRAGLSLDDALARAPARRPAAPSTTSRWRELSFDRASGTVTRPAEVALDSGGVAKGLFADLLVALLRDHPSVVIDCGGDLRLGGSAPQLRTVEVASPFDGGVLHSLRLARGGVATSGIGRRSWVDERGAPAHHLLDPSSGRPAYTGVVQVTALAPSAVEAEARAKAALLGGSLRASDWLPHGGVIVRDDGTQVVIECGRDPRPRAVVSLRDGATSMRRTEPLLDAAGIAV